MDEIAELKRARELGATYITGRVLIAALDAEKARHAQLRASIAALLVEGESWVAAGPLRALLKDTP